MLAADSSKITIDASQFDSNSAHEGAGVLAESGHFELRVSHSSFDGANALHGRELRFALPDPLACIPVVLGFACEWSQLRGEGGGGTYTSIFPP